MRHHEGRYKRVAVGNTFWPALIGSGPHRYDVVEGGLPHDARLVYAYHDEQGICLYLVFESESFDIVPCDDPFPELNLALVNIK